MTVVVASEPPRLCEPGEWSDNAATRFTVLYHPFCLSPLYSRSLAARALAPFHTICNFPASPVFPLRQPPGVVLFLCTFLRASLFISPMRDRRAVAFRFQRVHAYFEGNPREAIIVVKRARIEMLRAKLVDTLHFI